MWWYQKRSMDRTVVESTDHWIQACNHESVDRSVQWGVITNIINSREVIHRICHHLSPTSVSPLTVTYHWNTDPWYTWPWASHFNFWRWLIGRWVGGMRSCRMTHFIWTRKKNNTRELWKPHKFYLSALNRRMMYILCLKCHRSLQILEY